MTIRDDDRDLAIIFGGLLVGGLVAFSLGTSIAVGTIAGGALAQGTVVWRRRQQRGTTR